MGKKKKIGLGIGIIALALFIGIFAFGDNKVTADEKDYNTIKEELKTELKQEYDTKITELETKITELNTKLDTKEAELKKAIETGDKTVESKITFDTANKNREEDKKANPDKYKEEKRIEENNVEQDYIKEPVN